MVFPYWLNPITEGLRNYRDKEFREFFQTFSEVMHLIINKAKLATLIGRIDLVGARLKNQIQILR